MTALIPCCDYTFIAFFQIALRFVCLCKLVLLFVYEILFHWFSTPIANMKARSS